MASLSWQWSGDMEIMPEDTVYSTSSMSATVCRLLATKHRHPKTCAVHQQTLVLWIGMLKPFKGPNTSQKFWLFLVFRVITEKWSTSRLKCGVFSFWWDHLLSNLHVETQTFSSHTHTDFPRASWFELRSGQVPWVFSWYLMPKI